MHPLDVTLQIGVVGEMDVTYWADHSFFEMRSIVACHCLDCVQTCSLSANATFLSLVTLEEIFYFWTVVF
jgi:hypothetical protein